MSVPWRLEHESAAETGIKERGPPHLRDGPRIYMFGLLLICLHVAVSQSGFGNEYGHIVAGKGDVVAGHAAGRLAVALAPAR